MNIETQLLEANRLVNAIHRAAHADLATQAGASLLADIGSYDIDSSIRHWARLALNAAEPADPNLACIKILQVFSNYDSTSNR